MLLDLEADPNRQDRKGRTPAHCGCAKGQFETVKILRERRANMWLRNSKGDLPVHEAASSGRRELVQWLLDQKPKQVNVTSNDGRSLLHIAAGNDNTDMCKVSCKLSLFKVMFGWVVYYIVLCFKTKIHNDTLYTWTKPFGVWPLLSINFDSFL